MTIQTGQILKARAIGDADCIFTCEVIERKGQYATVKVEGDREPRRVKVRNDGEGEYLRPDTYSMAPVFRAPAEHPPVLDVPADTYASREKIYSQRTTSTLKVQVAEADRYDKERGRVELRTQYLHNNTRVDNYSLDELAAIRDAIADYLETEGL